VNPAAIGAFVHRFAPHSREAIFVASVLSAIAALLFVYGYSRTNGSHKHLPLNWVVTTATIAAPVPTWCLLLVMPLDHDLATTAFEDPIVVGLAGLYGIAAACRDIRRMARQARKSFDRGDPPTEDKSSLFEALAWSAW
jgi:hypothetical protein